MDVVHDIGCRSTPCHSLRILCVLISVLRCLEDDIKTRQNEPVPSPVHDPSILVTNDRCRNGCRTNKKRRRESLRCMDGGGPASTKIISISICIHRAHNVEFPFPRSLFSLQSFQYIRFLVCPIIIIIIIIVRVYTNFSLDRDGQSFLRRFEKRTANLSTSFGKRFPAGEGEAHYSKEVAVGGHSNHRSFPRPSIETFESRLGRKEERKKAGNETSRLVSKKSDDN